MGATHHSPVHPSLPSQPITPQSIHHSPVDQVQIRSQVVALEVTKELRKILLEENLKGSEILQHLAEEEEEKRGEGGRKKKMKVRKMKQRTGDEEDESSPVRGQL